MKTWIHRLWIFFIGFSFSLNAQNQKKPEIQSQPTSQNQKRRKISHQTIPNQSIQMSVYTETPANQQLNQLMTLSVELVSHIKETNGAREKWKLTAFDARMPEHNHGMIVKSSISSQGEGKWSIAPVKLHMRGHWVLYFTFEADKQVHKLEQHLQIN